MPYLRPLEIVQGQTATAEFILDAETALDSSNFSVTLERLSGEELATLVTTVDAYSVTISSVASDTAIVSSPDTSRAVGDPVLHIPANGVNSRLWVSSWADAGGGTAAVQFEAEPISPLQAADVLKGCKATAAIPSAQTSELGVNFRIRWVVTDSAGAVTSHDQRVYVVRSGFPETPSITDAARFVSANWPSEYELQRGERLRRIAFAAQDKLRNELMGRGRYAHLTGADSSTFHEAGLLALQSVLLMEGFFHADVDRVAYSESLNKRFFGAVMTGLRSLTHYDANADGTLSDAERMKYGGIPANRY